jgi:acyl-CoA reductase-like NAD-dependent aldehyde dehydrogenase
MERETELLAEIESLDNGKCVSIAKAADLNLSIAHMRYYAGWADKTHGQNVDVGTDFNAFTRLEPFGVCGQIIPWNFPLLMLSWKWAPVCYESSLTFLLFGGRCSFYQKKSFFLILSCQALITGNVIVMKTSEKTPLSALKMCELAIEAGFPPGVINVLSGMLQSSFSKTINYKFPLFLHIIEKLDCHLQYK